MSQELTTYEPQNLKELKSFVEDISVTDFVPQSYKSGYGANAKPKKADMVIACQMGRAIGMNVFQSLQNIAVVNGRPCIWGDALIALILSHPAYDGQETKELRDTDGNFKGYEFTIKRKPNTSVTRSYTLAEAESAGLYVKKSELGKLGDKRRAYEFSPWCKHPKRMVLMRARGFALRDAFADALMGFSVAEEMEDTVPLEQKIVESVPSQQQTAPKVNEADRLIGKLRQYTTKEQLNQNFNAIMNLAKTKKCSEDDIARIEQAFGDRLSELSEDVQEVEEADVEEVTEEAVATTEDGKLAF